MSAPGQAKENDLRTAGFSDSEIGQWRDRTRAQLAQGGFTPLEQDNYFGVQEPDFNPWRALVHGQMFGPNGFLTGELPSKPSGKDDSFINVTHPLESHIGGPVAKAAKEGFQSSVTGLSARGAMPDGELAPDASTTERLAFGAAQMAGDLPAMIAGTAVGGLVGGEAGGEAPIVGNVTGAVLGGGAGAMATPELLRQTMMDAYANGSVKSSDDFVERARHILTETAKQGAVGALTMGAGKFVEPFLPVTRPFISTATKLATEATTAATASKGIEGKLPEPKDFEDAAIMIFGLHAAGAGAAKLRTIYAKTGVLPSQVWQDAKTDPGVKHDLSSSDVVIPDRYQIETPETQVITGDLGKPLPQAEGESQASISVKPAPKSAPVQRPTDLLKFLAKKGGLAREQGDYSGHLENMGAHRTFIPGAGMLVRKDGGLSFDYAREAAEQAGYGPYGDGDIAEFIEAIDNALRGGDEFSHNDLDQVRAYQEQMAQKRAGDAPDAHQSAFDQLTDLRNKAETLGIEHQDDWTADDLQAAVTEREAIRAENMSDDDVQRHLDLQELDLDRYISTQYPHLTEGLKSNGYESDIPFGPEPSETAGTQESSGRHEAGPGGPAGDANAVEGTGSHSEFTTAKGSVYRIYDDGTTIRDKAYRPEHGVKEQGIQPRSQATFYVTAEDVDKLGLFQTEGPAKAIEQRSDGSWAVKYLNGKDKGKFERRTVVTPQGEPAVGLTPIEIFNDGKTVHFGNEITKVGSDITAEKSGQLVIPGAEQSAKQLAAARDTAGHGRTGSRVEQSAADQGLFAPQKSSDAGLFDKSGKLEWNSETGALVLVPPKRTYSPSEKAILDRLAEKPEQKRPLSWQRLYTDTVDDLNPVRVMEQTLLGKGEIDTKESPYTLMRLFRGTAGKVEQFLERSPFEYKSLKNVGKSLKDVLAPVKDDLDGLRAYLVARRAVELEGRGVTTGIPMDAANEVIKTGDAKYAEIAQGMQDYQRHLLNYLRDSGVLSKDGYNKIIAANEEYVPFYRLMEPDEQRGGPSARGKVKNPVKKIKGSERKIIDPLESIVRNTDLYVRLAEKNRALTTLVDFADKYDLGEEFLSKSKAPIAPIEISSDELAKFLKEQGINADASEAFTVFRPKAFQPSRDEIAVFKNGKRSIYRLDRDLADAVEHMDPEILPWYVRLLSYPAKTLRAGATLIPDFILRNLFRDQITATSLSNYKYVPFWGAIEGLKSTLAKDDTYQNWLKSGGANGAMVSLDRRYMEQNIFGLARQTGLTSRVINAVTTPFEMLRVASEIAENATRVGMFKKAMNATSDPLKSAFESREGTLDFARIGAKMRAVNAITAFANAGIQGIDRTVRAFKDNPVGMTARTVAAITVPSVLLWWANHDDPRWKGIPDWEKDLFWIVMTKDHIYRIPKPFELGVVFGSLPERVLDAFVNDNPQALKAWSSSFIAGLTPNYIPTVALPVIEGFANRSTFTGNKLVPDSMEGILPEYQYTPYTTESAKQIGKYIALLPGMKESQFASPIMLENYVRAWAGGLGTYALQTTDYALRKAGVVNPPPAPEGTLADIPFVKAFVVRYPSASDQRIQNFYDRYDTFKKEITTIQTLARRGEPEAAMRELKIAQDSDTLLRMDALSTGLSKMEKEIRMITIMPDMKPAEKRQMIDGLYSTMIQASDQGNQMIDQFQTRTP